MSSLYIRLRTGFYTHRKTARLRALIGDAAYWIPPRLWAYCAEHQPDGNLSSYSSEEISMLIGCSEHASSILGALKSCGFLDGDGAIHGWEEHNGYHQSYSLRAKAAADVRWEKKKEAKKKDTDKDTDKDRDRDKDIETSIAPRMRDACLEHASSMRDACLEHACSIYDAYPKKVGKPAAMKSILKALSEFPPEMVLTKTKEYAASRAGQDSCYTPHPSTWFNEHRFNDSPETWKKSGKPTVPEPKQIQETIAVKFL